MRKLFQCNKEAYVKLYVCLFDIFLHLQNFNFKWKLRERCTLTVRRKYNLTIIGNVCPIRSVQNCVGENTVVAKTLGND